MDTLQKRYEISRLHHIAHLVFASAIAMVTLATIFNPDISDMHTSNWVLIPFFLFTLYGVYLFASMPQYIELTTDGQLRFSSLMGVRIMHLGELKSIKTESMGYYVIFGFKNASFKVLNRINGLYELISTLKARQPAIVVKGL